MPEELLIAVRFRFAGAGQKTIPVKIAHHGTHCVMDRSRVAEADFLLGRMNIEVDQGRIHGDKENGKGMGSVREIPLGAVFHCLYKTVFLDSPSVHEDHEILAVRAGTIGRTRDNRGGKPLRRRFDGVKEAFVFTRIERREYPGAEVRGLGKHQRARAAAGVAERNAGPGERLFDDDLPAKRRFGCRTLEKLAPRGKVREKAAKLHDGAFRQTVG
ncbi:MAG: hypothetical protein BWY20_02327 [Spirochaetes bacterium ADurb.Bin215]|nr:MAG: hypothetical protein BWY20_02327 [Spirochaetes bacterium ADurb.Bin215]